VPEIPIIHPRAIYSIASMTATLSLKPGTVPREIRLHRLRCAKRAGRIFITGQWILQWIQEGERIRQPAEEAAV